MQKRMRDGFEGQTMWVIPKSILTKWAVHPMLLPLMPTDIGWYPQALYHYREREEGADEHILIFCIEGKGWYEIEGVRQSIEANEAILIPRHVAHSYGSDEHDPWSIHWVHFS